LNPRWPLLVSSACAAYHPAFTRYDDGDYRLAPAEKNDPPPPWAVSPLPSGDLLSPDWTATPTKLRSKGPSRFNLFYKHESTDRMLEIDALPLADEDARKSVGTLGERGLNDLRRFAFNLAIGVAVPTEPLIVDGAEAQQTIYAISRPGDSAPIRRTYLAVIKPFSLQEAIYVYYAAPPGQFDAGLEEAKSFVRRFHFDSDGVPKSPGVGKPPEKKPDEPAPPKEPSKPRYLPAGAAVPG
jgi:hypothetical protein